MIERDPRDLLWGRLPRLLLTSGALADSGADRTELLVLMGIASHVDDFYRSSVSMLTLADCARVTDRAARNAVKRLEERGIVSVKRGGGRNVKNSYTINTEALHFLVTEDKRGSPELPSNERETRKSESQYPEVSGPKLGSTGLPPKRIKEEKKQQGAAAAGVDDSPDPIRQALILACVGEPMRTKLADHPLISTH